VINSFSDDDVENESRNGYSDAPVLGGGCCRDRGKGSEEDEMLMLIVLC
jgi:hypothetical protein